MTSRILHSRVAWFRESSCAWKVGLVNKIRLAARNLYKLGEVVLRVKLLSTVCMIAYELPISIVSV